MKNKSMIIIIEGIDRVGKTTLCNLISKEFNIPIYKHEGKFLYHNMDNDNETDKMIQLIEICRLLDGVVIFDRFHLTDAVYGIIERGYDVDKAFSNFDYIEETIINSKIATLLIKVNPLDINASSFQHGYSLLNHQDNMTIFYNRSFLEKYETDFDDMVSAVERVRGFINENLFIRH